MDTTNLIYMLLLTVYVLIMFVKLMLKIIRDSERTDKHIEGARMDLPFDSYIVFLKIGDRIIPLMDHEKYGSVQTFATASEAQSFIDTNQKQDGVTYHIQGISLCS